MKHRSSSTAAADDRRRHQDRESAAFRLRSYPLTNPRNPHLKLVRRLRQRKVRDETGLFVVEGIRPVGEAVEAGAPVEYFCYSPDLLESDYACRLLSEQAERGVRCYPVAADVFRSLAEKENPQGILAVVRRAAAELDSLTPRNFPWGVAVVAPQDPGNIGTLVRTIDAVGAAGLLLLDGGADPVHPNAVRASMGTIFWHPIAVAAFADFAAWAARQGYHVYGTSAHGAVDYRRIAVYRRPCILLLGNEQKGLTEAEKAVCEQLISLPMCGRASSLNLAVAAGVFLYEMAGKLEPAAVG